MRVEKSHKRAKSQTNESLGTNMSLKVLSENEYETAAKFLEENTSGIQLHKQYTAEDLRLFNAFGNFKLTALIKRGKIRAICGVLDGDFAVPDEKDGSPNEEYAAWIDPDEMVCENAAHRVNWVDGLENDKDDTGIEFVAGDPDACKILINEAVKNAKGDYVFFEADKNDEASIKVIKACGFKHNSEEDNSSAGIDWLWFEIEKR